jgi:hypothetical protein
MLDEWLHEITAAASRNDTSKSIDVIEVIEALENTSQWGYSWKKFWASGGDDQRKALLYLARTRCPPWELRLRIANLSFCTNAFRREVHAFFEVNHPDKTVIFTMFKGLPPFDEVNDDT